MENFVIQPDEAVLYDSKMKNISGEFVSRQFACDLDFAEIDFREGKRDI